MPKGGLLAEGFFNVRQRRSTVQSEGGVVIGHAVYRLVLPAPSWRGPVIMLDASLAYGESFAFPNKLQQKVTIVNGFLAPPLVAGMQ